jgi:hypothetical protein
VGIGNLRQAKFGHAAFLSDPILAGPEVGTMTAQMIAGFSRNKTLI